MVLADFEAHESDKIKGCVFDCKVYVSVCVSVHVYIPVKLFNHEVSYKIQDNFINPLRRLHGLL